MHTQVLVWTDTFVAFGQIPRSGVVGWGGRHVFNIRSHQTVSQTVFRTGCVILCSHQLRVGSIRPTSLLTLGRVSFFT